MDKSTPDKEAMSYDEWFNASAETMAQHISLNPPATEYEREAKHEKASIVDKTANHMIEQIDEIDPNFS